MNANFSINYILSNNKSIVIPYKLSANEVAQKWFSVLRHIWRVPLDRTYTTAVDPTVDAGSLSKEMSEGISKINNIVGNTVYEVKDLYTQEDCTHIHSLVIDTQYDQNDEVRELMHYVHRKLHTLETLMRGEIKDRIYVGWSEREGPLTKTYPGSVYEHYQGNLKAGHCYLTHSEFGKTPWSFYIHDRAHIDTEDHFFTTCKAHTTFRPSFEIQTTNFDYNQRVFPQEFYDWFRKYQVRWNDQYNSIGIKDWNPVYNKGGVELAIPLKDIDWGQIKTVDSINLQHLQTQ